jgi:hypothetical protein
MTEIWNLYASTVSYPEVVWKYSGSHGTIEN